MIATSSSLAQAEAYFDAWNAHDPEAVAAAFTEDGTYTDPTVTGGPLNGSALAEHARALFTGFPDLTFEILRAQPHDNGARGAVVASWLMRGTNTGPLRGLAPTGRRVELRGVDVITFTDGKITSVEGMFDRQTLSEQLGMQMRAVPPAGGPFEFGYAVRATSGSPRIPGAVSLTWLDVRSEQEADQVKLTAAAIAAEMTGEPGFIGWLAVEIGRRLYTITAWDDADAVHALMRSTTHKEAVRQFFSEDLGAAAATGVWRVHHLNPVRVRCLSCGQMTDPAGANGACDCGRPVPESPPYW
jgi:steroid delta-isomerase-like uncharacterized protein